MSPVHERERLRQRADYTYKFNMQTGRHGWLRLTPAYSLKIVEEIIVDSGRAKRIFDPFCGTGTTALCAAYHGHESYTTDINPFLLWLTRAKTAQYSLQEIAAAHEACTVVLDYVRERVVEPIPSPPLHNIGRWWNDQSLHFLRRLRAAIAKVTTPHSAEETLLLIAFCRSLMGVSNAAFNHQSLSFKDDRQLDIGLTLDLSSTYAQDVRFVLQGASDNPAGIARVLLGDARTPAGTVDGPFDLVVTSPPYANRMSYIRELRPYMYWLGFLSNGRDAGELDWAAIGGTWGIATSRLVDWGRSLHHFQSDRLAQVLDLIARADRKSGVVLANYVAKYFDDMWRISKVSPPCLLPVPRCTTSSAIRRFMEQSWRLNSYTRKCSRLWVSSPSSVGKYANAILRKNWWNMMLWPSGNNDYQQPHRCPVTVLAAIDKT